MLFSCSLCQFCELQALGSVTPLLHVCISFQRAAEPRDSRQEDTSAPSRGRHLSPSFLSGSGAWGAPWKHTKDTCSLWAPRAQPRLTVPDRPYLGPLDQGLQTPFGFCWAPFWPVGVPMPSLPSVLPPARPRPDAVGSLSPSWACTMARLQPHLWHCLPPWQASVRGCQWPCYWPQLCPLSSGPAGQCSLRKAWPSLGSPWC